MEIEFSCGDCRTVNRSDLESEQSNVCCASCGKSPGQVSAFSNPETGIHKCIICGCRDLYVQKDFNRKIGCAIVALGAVLAPFTRLISLFVCAFIDLILYLVLPLITVCYRCGSIYRDFPRNPDHEGFNLGINDRYRSAERADGADSGARDRK